MSFFANAVRLIKGRKRMTHDSVLHNDNSAQIYQDVDLDFSVNNYVKNSFSSCVVKPLSGYVLKIIGGCAFIISGTAIGILLALLCFFVFLQFGSIENTFISSLIFGRFEELLPESDLSIKSAMLRWNSDLKAFEVSISRVKLDDLCIPNISIIPNYEASLRAGRFVAKTVSIMNPKINMDVSSNFKKISLNPNLEKGENTKSLLEPLSSMNYLTCLLDEGVKIKIMNASASVTEGGINWKLKNAYCEYVVGEDSPRSVNFSLSLPKQDYTSGICITKSQKGKYKVKIESLNPIALNSVLSERNVPISRDVVSLLDGYDLPISGTLNLNFDESRFLGGKFDLVGGAGTIRIPTKNTLSLNLGKKIDNGSISGSFTESGAKIDSINISYGNSGLQLTGIQAPLGEFKFLDIANIDGSLNLTNIDVSEMEAILPENISRSAITAFKNYLPGFKIESFKVDLRGPIAFGTRKNVERLKIGRGIFKIKDAKVPFGENIITNVTATGVLANDGVDIRLSGASFGDAKINNGVFFISNKDNSCIGNVNADVTVDNIAEWANGVSPKLSSLPLDKLGIKTKSNIDLKLVHIKGDKLLRKDFPFRVVGGKGVIKSDDNSKELRFSWNDDKLVASGDIATAKNRVTFKIKEDIAKSSGVGEFCFVSNSEFLESFMPKIKKMCEGAYKLKIDSSWSGNKEQLDLDMDLKDATMVVPILGDVKLRNEDGHFSAHITNNDGCLDISKMKLNTKDHNISGKMSLDKDGNLLKCSLEEFKVKDGSAKINFLKKDGKLLFSAVGDYIDASNGIKELSDVVSDNTVISAYINMKEMTVANTQRVKNVKGNIDILNGKIIGGAGYGVIGTDTTLAFTAKNIKGTSDVLLSLSAANAGEFLKYLKVTDNISGGQINFVFKSPKNSDSSLSGAFELKDFIVKNSPLLTRMISLSSTSWLPNADNVAVGFNFCVGNFISSDGHITIERGKAIGPTVCISCNGSYDRKNDHFNITGISLPMTAMANNKTMGGALVADYKILGSLGMPSLSVKPLTFVTDDSLNEIFGNMLPVTMVSPGMPTIREKVSDPFDQEAFDRPVEKKRPEPVSSQSILPPIKKIKPKKGRGKRGTSANKFGVKIIRGAG